MSELEQRITRTLYRSSCPSSTELGEYHLELLPEDRAAAVRQHLVDCPYCSAEVAQLKAFLREVETDLDYSLAEKIQIWIAERIPQFPDSQEMTPAFALRGSERPPQVYRAGEAEVTLEYESDPAQKGKGTLLGLLSGVDPKGLQATLWKAERKVDATTLDELGNFVLDGIEADHYQLILTGESFEIHLDDVDIE
jgi:hypothetical protein